MLSVSALGAVCELRAGASTVSQRAHGDSDQGAGLSFKLDEFAEVSDGRRLRLRSDRGWANGRLRVAWSLREPDELSPGPPNVNVDMTDRWQFVTRQSLTESVLACVDPDDGEQWYEWVRARLCELDVDVDLASIRAAPYRVEFGPVLDGELRKRSR